MTLGVVLGGRLGFVLFYEPIYYLNHPAEILQVWRGGMAFHGASSAAELPFGLCAARRCLALVLDDMCAAAVPIGLFFGRIEFHQRRAFRPADRRTVGMVF